MASNKPSTIFQKEKLPETDFLMVQSWGRKNYSTTLTYKHHNDIIKTNKLYMMIIWLDMPDDFDSFNVGCFPTKQFQNQRVYDNI